MQQRLSLSGQSSQFRGEPYRVETSELFAHDFGINGVVGSRGDSEALIAQQIVKNHGGRPALSWNRQDMKGKTSHIANHLSREGYGGVYGESLADRPSQYTRHSI